MAFAVKVIADSITSQGARLTSLQLEYPRFIHGELLTHRKNSRNSSSSRAIPVAKLIEQVRRHPAMPIHWGKNQPGMQAREELDEMNRSHARGRWVLAAESAANQAKRLAELGTHKQVVNRLLEPFQWMHTIVTATEWDNFFALRCHPDAQPEFQHLACMMRDAMDASTPVLRDKYGSKDAWHLPYVTEEERYANYGSEPYTVAKISAARCARVSYMKHDGSSPSVEEDLKLFHRLAGGEPIHASPLEHQGIPLANGLTSSRNFTGWHQFRAIWEDSEGGQ